MKKIKYEGARDGYASPALLVARYKKNEGEWNNRLPTEKYKELGRDGEKCQR